MCVGVCVCVCVVEMERGCERQFFRGEVYGCILVDESSQKFLRVSIWREERMSTGMVPVYKWNFQRNILCFIVSNGSFVCVHFQFIALYFKWEIKIIYVTQIFQIIKLNSL